MGMDSFGYGKKLLWGCQSPPSPPIPFFPPCPPPPRTDSPPPLLHSSPPSPPPPLQATCTTGCMCCRARTSSYPTPSPSLPLPPAGGMYYWMHVLSGPVIGPGLCWVIGWLNLLGQVSTGSCVGGGHQGGGCRGCQ